MSDTYKNLSQTTFPNSVDNKYVMVDPSNDDISLINQYQSFISSGNITAANDFLSKHTELIPMCFNADKWNRHENMIIAIEQHYKDQVENYILNLAKNKGDYVSSSAYDKYNVVAYSIEGVKQYYMAINNVPVNKLPTNTAYWIPITIKGEKGEAGAGLSYAKAWDSSITYSSNQCVSYQGYLWASLKDGNKGNNPVNDGGTNWDRIFKVSTEAQYVEFSDGTTVESWRNITDNLVSKNANDVNILNDWKVQSDGLISKNIADITELKNNTFSKTDIIDIQNGGTGADNVITALDNLGGFKKSDSSKANDKFDNITDEGLYAISNNANNPFGTEGYLTVINEANSSRNIKQIFMPISETLDSSEMYSRNYIGGSWTDWKSNKDVSRLSTARTFSISGGCYTNPVSFDGSKDVSMYVTNINPNFFSSPVPISKGGTGATTVKGVKDTLNIGKTIFNGSCSLGNTIVIPSISEYQAVIVFLDSEVPFIGLTNIGGSGYIKCYSLVKNSSSIDGCILTLNCKSGQVTYSSCEGNYSGTITHITGIA